MKKNKYLVTSLNLNKMSNEENKDSGGENPPQEEQPNAQETQQNPPEQPQEGAQPENQNENEAQPNENQPEQPQPNPEEPEQQNPNPPPEEGEGEQKNPEQEGEGEGGEGEGEAPDNEEEEDEEGEDGSDAVNSSERKENDYNSRELENFLAICDHVVKPLEQKDIITRSLTNFQNNIKNSLDQIDKNFTLQRIDLPNQPNKDIAKDSQSVRALEEVVKKYTESITIAQEQLTNYPKNITSAMMEIDNRKRAVSNWSILAQQLKSENTQRIVEKLSKMQMTTLNSYKL